MGNSAGREPALVTDDTDQQPAHPSPALPDDRPDRPDWRNAATLAFMHVGCLAVYWVGWSPTAVGAALALYVLRAFGVTAFYHRYFSHRAFRTSRWFQFAGALLGCFALQKGPLWWAAHHRQHHRCSDRKGDVHSPHVDGFLWSHLMWFLTPRNDGTKTADVRDWLHYPELRWLDRLSAWVALAYAALLYGAGEALDAVFPALQTNGPQLFVWGFFLSTVFLYHVTYSVNSFAHLFGKRRYETPDDSRNNALVALLTLGEGWHNNHHHYPSSARNGFFWWEVDVTWYALLLLEKLGLVWNLRPVPQHILAATNPGKLES